MNDDTIPLAGGPVPQDSIAIHVVGAGDRETVIASLGDAARTFAAALNAGPPDTLLLPDQSGRIASVVVAAAKANDPFGPLSLGAIARTLPRGIYHLADTPCDPVLAALGWTMGAYRFTRYRKAKGKRAVLVLPDAGVLAQSQRLARGITWTRDLINTPANDMGPAEIEAAARQLASRHNAKISVIVGDDLLDRGFPLIHAVGRASPRAPRLIDLRWGDADAPKVTLVGKGVAFDTGGLDLKPAAGMLLMKKDMAGAANVLGLALMLMDAGAPISLRVLIPAVENVVSGSAFRPGDVLASRKGLSVEVANTDAEGRLILADALTLADEEAPDLLIDMATLTGAARIALGPDLPPYYTRDDSFAATFDASAAATADPAWRLPLWAPYDTWVDGDISDVNNAPGKPFAGSIAAALFLGRFVKAAKTWVHFDVFGWAPETRPHGPKGGEAQCIRALDALIRARFIR
ncbi:Peptidase B [hydrothermal vent metagenome]|uniref:Peptidase B n=1 Tax=hydrothermal vent metagenome TaxID=652676 RepID=A0A3B0S206_9ZZZZ